MDAVTFDLLCIGVIAILVVIVWRSDDDDST